MKTKKKNRKSVVYSTPIKKEYQIQPDIIRKIYRCTGYDPALYDSYSKKQKAKFSDIHYYLPIFKVEKGSSVPRPYIKFIREKIYKYLNTNYIGEESNQLSYMDFIIYAPMVNMVFQHINQDKTTNDSNEEMMVSLIMETVKKTGNYLITLLNYCSRVTFRTYGFLIEITEPFLNISTKSIGIKLIINLSSKENNQKKFNFNGITRTAYSCLRGKSNADGFKHATISLKEIYPERKEDINYLIYVQPHAIHRIKERVDIFDPMAINLLITNSLIYNKEITESHSGKLLKCEVEKDIVVGYFTFETQGENLCISTFLPLTSKATPEGRKLFHLLGLNRDEIKYLGMDKLSFFSKVDFNQIPILKDALMQSGIWKIKEYITQYPNEKNDTEKINMKKTQFVKSFFNKKAELEEEKQLLVF